MDKGLITHAVIYNEKGEVLITRRSQENDVLPGFWDMPGGTLEDGELPVEGVKREVAEEVNVEISEPSLFYCHSNVDQKKNKQFVTLIFIAEYKSREVNLNPEEHDAYEWIGLEDIDNYQVVHYMKDCFEYLRNKKHSILEYSK